MVFINTIDSECARCEQKLPAGSFQFRESGQFICLCCAHLNDFAFLPKTNRRLTHQVLKETSESIKVVKFSGKKYERQGILVNKKIMEKAYQVMLDVDDD